MTNADIIAAEDDLRGVGALALGAAFLGHEDGEEAGKEEAGDGNEDDAVGDEEAPDLEGAGAVGEEGRVGEGEDDG